MAQRSEAEVALGRAVRDLRQKRGISQEDFAHLSGVHRTYMSGIERGLRNPSYKNIRKIAEALGLHAWELVKHAEQIEKDGTEPAQT